MKLLYCLTLFIVGFKLVGYISWPWLLVGVCVAVFLLLNHFYQKQL